MKHYHEFQQRVIEERESLDDKIKKLIAFLASEGFNELQEEDAQLLKDQADAMMDYSNVLKRRIARF